MFSPTRLTHNTIPVNRQLRARTSVRALAATALALGLGLTACSTGSETLSLPASTSVQVEEFGEWPTTSAEPQEAPAQSGETSAANDEFDPLPVGPPNSAIREQVSSLDSALENLERISSQVQGPEPVGLSIGSLDVLNAQVNPVGVTDTGEMEIPGPSEVGWYRFGASPGETGSAVLAAHIAYDGSDGVFRNLTELQPGDQLWVHYNDGTSQQFQVEALRQYDKNELPKEQLFSKDGKPLLALITCGGDFQPTLQSYEDNIVALAVPV